jgi:hypothetical protein
VHPVVLAVFRDFEQMSQQELQRVVVFGRQRLDDICSKLIFT